jgi:hypothetical protein
MTRTDSSERSELPIACTLGPDQGARRLDRWKALSANGRPTVRREGHRLEVRYASAPGISEELEALAAAERLCCSFAAWDVKREKTHVVLHVTSDPSRPEAIDAIADLFGADSSPQSQ